MHRLKIVLFATRNDSEACANFMDLIKSLKSRNNF